MRLTSGLRWFALSLALAVGLVLGAHAVADAHTTLVSSEPAAGSTLTNPPSRIRLVFSEQIEPSMAMIALVGTDGTSHPLPANGDPRDVHAIIAPLPPLASGVFRVAWHVVSADGHPVGSSYLFTIGAGGVAPPDAAAASAEGPPTWGPTLAGAPLVPAMLRGVAVGAMMAAGGLLLFIVWLGDERQTRPVSLARWLVLIAPVFTIAHLAAWMANAAPDHQLSASWMDATMASTVGRVEVWRTILSLAPLWALWLARRTALALVLSAVVLLASAAIGHSAATDALFAIPSKALHLLAGAAWLGGLLWIAVRDERAATADRDALRVSAVALAAMLIVLLSGVLQTLILLPIRDLASAYGAVVGAKVLGLLMLVAFGAYNRYRLLPALSVGSDPTAARAALRTTVRREIGVMTLVILLGGLLSYVSPPAHAGVRSPSSTPDAHP